jgi:hypothetical protein
MRTTYTGHNLIGGGMKCGRFGLGQVLSLVRWRWVRGYIWCYPLDVFSFYVFCKRQSLILLQTEKDKPLLCLRSKDVVWYETSDLNLKTQ